MELLETQGVFEKNAKVIRVRGSTMKKSAVQNYYGWVGEQIPLFFLSLLDVSRTEIPSPTPLRKLQNAFPGPCAPRFNRLDNIRHKHGKY